MAWRLLILLAFAWQPLPAGGQDRPPELRLPPRAADALAGSKFAKQIEPLSSAEREAAILREVTRGNVPEFLRSLKAIEVTAADAQGVNHRAIYFVTPDYLAVGSDADFFRVP